ncbi:MAG: glycerate kinase [Armatimonadetes bacterium]|nr:glycerate kinase [Armatimonadota bacterium]
MPMNTRDIALAVFRTSLASADPAGAVRNHMTLSGEILKVGPEFFPLQALRHILVVGAGKASAAMAWACEELLGERIHKGLVLTKDGHAPTSGKGGKIRVLEGAHPIPDERCLSGTQELLSILSEATEEDLVICLISGGGSALLEDLPEEITLSDLAAVTDFLLRCGAPIQEINVVRKHLSRVKGGQLLRHMQGAAVVSLVISDVIGAPLSAIASGPTVPDPSTFQEATDILMRYCGGEKSDIPPAIVSYFEKGIRGNVLETLKEGDPALSRSRTLVIAGNRSAADAAIKACLQQGISPVLLTAYLEGEAREAGKMFAAIAREIRATGNPSPVPCCMVASGETTVTVKGKGLGGRNQELALSAAMAMDGLPDVLLLAGATDGSDGPTDAAGAIASGDTIRRARAQGMNPREYLDQNDAYHFFDNLGDLIRTGPTGTNVNDLYLLFCM